MSTTDTQDHFKTPEEWAVEIDKYLRNCAMLRMVPTKHVMIIEQIMRQAYDDSKDAVRLTPVENAMATGCVVRREAERLGVLDD